MIVVVHCFLDGDAHSSISAPMPERNVTPSRLELLELVWSIPMNRIVTEYGVPIAAALTACAHLGMPMTASGAIRFHHAPFGVVASTVLGEGSKIKSLTVTILSRKSGLRSVPNDRLPRSYQPILRGAVLTSMKSNTLFVPAVSVRLLTSSVARAPQTLAGKTAVLSSLAGHLCPKWWTSNLFLTLRADK